MCVCVCVYESVRITQCHALRSTNYFLVVPTIAVIQYTSIMTASKHYNTEKKFSFSLFIMYSISICLQAVRFLNNLPPVPFPNTPVTHRLFLIAAVENKMPTHNSVLALSVCDGSLLWWRNTNMVYLLFRSDENYKDP